MESSYKQLTLDERYQIKAYLEMGYSLREIAKKLLRNVSTICREIKRNTGKKGYRPKQAQNFSDSRKSKGNKRISIHMWALVAYCIKLDWSPEQIHGRLTFLGMKGVPSPEWIYVHIYEDKAKGGTLYKHLRCQKLRKKRHGSGQERRGRIPDRKPISDRPLVANNRERFGDFEGDTIVGKGHSGVILTHVDRRSRYLVMSYHPNRKADVISNATIETLADLDVKTITYDNGKEFAAFKEVEEALGVDVYFANTYASWERGTNENTNGLIRQYLPKKMKFENLDPELIEAIQNKINNRPRKVLGYRTPAEVFLDIGNKGVALGT